MNNHLNKPENSKYQQILTILRVAKNVLVERMELQTNSHEWPEHSRVGDSFLVSKGNVPRQCHSHESVLRQCAHFHRDS